MDNIQNKNMFKAGLLCLISIYQKDKSSNNEIIEVCFQEETFSKLLDMKKVLLEFFKVSSPDCPEGNHKLYFLYILLKIIQFRNCIFNWNIIQILFQKFERFFIFL